MSAFPETKTEYCPLSKEEVILQNDRAQIGRTPNSSDKNKIGILTFLLSHNAERYLSDVPIGNSLLCHEGKRLG